jgi:RHS repeat-associated protein
MRLHHALFAATLLIASAVLAEGTASTSLGAAVTPTQCGPGDSGSPCGGAGVASLGNSSGTNQGAGNPINVITGNKYQMEVDLPALPGVLGLEIVRHYNSTHADERAPNGLLGRGWRLSYETELYAIGNTLQIMQADGTRLIFVRDAKHPSQCASTNPAHGKVRITRTARGEEYVWTWANGRILSFNPQGKLTQITAPSGEFVSLSRDVSGALVKVTDPQGRSLILGYPSRRDPEHFNGITHIDSPVGRFTYRYGGDAPKGYSGNPRALLANLAAVTFPDGVSRRYHFEDPAHPTLLTGISVQGRGAPAQRLSTWAYDAQGRGILSYKGEAPKAGQPGIEQVRLEYPAPGKTLLTNSLGQTTTYRHAIVGGEYRLLEVKGAGCASCGEANVKYGYDRLGRLTEETKLDDAGRPILTTRTERDGQGRPIKISGVTYRNGKPQPARLQVRYEYEGDSVQPSLIARPSVVQGKEHQIRMTYNAAGQIVSVSESGYSPNPEGKAPTPISRTTTYGYTTVNGRSLLSQIDGPLPNGKSHSPADSDVTRYEWDQHGNHLVRITHPMNLMEAFAYDEAGRASKVIGVNGVVTETRTNLRGQVLSTSRYPAGLDRRAAEAAGLLLTAATGYDTMGRVIQITRADGQSVTLRYDVNGQLAQLSDHLGNRVEWKEWNKGTREEGGQLTTQQWFSADAPDRIARAWYFWHDRQGRLIQRLAPDGGLDQWRYPQDASDTGFASSWATHTDPLGRVTARTQNAHGTAQVRVAPDGEIEASVQAADIMPKPVQPLDDFGRVVQFASPQHGTTTAEYNAAGQIVRITQPDGTRIDYDLDAAGRPLQKTARRDHTESSTVRFRYTAQGLAQVEDGAQTTAYTYDLLGRPIEKRITLNLLKSAHSGYTLRTRYDARGRVRARQLADGNWLVFTLNGKTGLPESIRLHHPILPGITERLAVWLGRPDLPVLLATRNTVVTDIEGSALDGITHYANGNGSVTNYRFDLAGRLIEIDQGGAAGQAGGRIVKAGYQYDAGRRLVAESVNESNTQYAYRGWNRLAAPAASTAAPAPRRDAAGRTLQDGQYQYRYDVWGRLQSVASVQSDHRQLAAYAHNAYGERVRATSGEHTRYYLYDNQKRVAELDEAGNILQQYFYLNDKPIAVLDSSRGDTELVALHTDRRGAPVAASDERGKVIWRASYSAWGSVQVQNLQAANEPTFQLDLRLPGQWEDRATHLHYNYQRDYNPANGRYLTPDPLGFPDGPDAYLYVGGDPLNKIDPLGLYQIDMHYYMTFFLGVTAGLDPEVARTIALAAQYIDDNPATSPVDLNINGEVDVYKSATTNQERLKYYHFMRDTLEYGDIHDPTNKGNQLFKLFTAYDKAPADCAKRVFFGEMLHALADTFSHADENNTPYKGVQIFNLGLGHGLNDSDPDYTFNHWGHGAIVNKLFGNVQPGPNNGATHWATNADRTLLAEQAMFDQFTSQSTWARSGGVGFVDIQDTLIAFNATGESEQYDYVFNLDGTHTRTKHADVDHGDVTAINFYFAKKLDILNSKLKALGFDIDLTDPNWGYSAVTAAQARDKALGNLKCADYPGVILPAGKC